MARNTRTFSDLDFNFTRHPVTNDVTMKYDQEAIKQSVKSLILTQNYERPFHSEIGSQIRALMFEPVMPMATILLKRAITDTIINFEPRVRLIDVAVKFSPDTNDVYVTIEFSIVNTLAPVSVNFILKRTR